MAGMNTEHHKSIENLPPPDTVRRKPGTGGIIFPVPYYHRWPVLGKKILQQAHNPLVQNLLCACTVLEIYSKYLCSAQITPEVNWAPQITSALQFLFD